VLSEGVAASSLRGVSVPCGAVVIDGGSAQMQDYADYKVMTQEDRRKLFSLLQVLKRELDGPKPPAQVCHRALSFAAQCL